MRNFKHNSWLALTAIVASALGSLGCGRSTSANAGAPAGGMPPAPVTVATAVQQPVPLEVTAIGNVQPYRTVQVKSMVDGQVARVLVQQGQEVHSGKLLFQLDKRPFEAAVAQAQGALDRAIATAENSRVQADRMQALLKEGVIAPQLAEQQTSQAKSDAAAVEAARAALRTAKLNLGYTDIRAPIDARAGAILVNLGNNVRANDVNPLITLNEITPIYVQFPLPEAQLSAVRARSDNGLEVRAFLQNEAAPALGKLTFIDNAVDASTGTIKLMGTFPNKDRRLWPGQFVNVQLVLGTEPKATVIPTIAVQSSQQGSYVFVVKSDGSAAMQPVAVARTYRQLAVVQSGVAPGDNVVVDGVYRVVPGNKVNVTKTEPVVAGPMELSAPNANAANGSAAQGETK